MADNYIGEGYKHDKEKKDEGCKVTVTINCCNKKVKNPCYDEDKRPSKDNDGCDVDVVINCCD